MDAVVEKSRAKINLSLDVLGVLENGYHEVEMIMQQIDLWDEVRIEKIQSGIVITSNIPYLPTDQNNIAYKAAQKMIERFDISSGVAIHLEKKVPVAAGLAGGSANAAAVIRGMNRLFDLNMPMDDMMALGLTLGADVPFCIQGGCAVARGIGEALTPVKSLDHVWILLSKPNIGVSTKEIYKRYDSFEISRHPDTPKLIQAIETGDLHTLTHQMYNVLEEVTTTLYPVILDVKRKIQQYGALGTMMSGSGPTVFGIFTSFEKAQKAEKHLKKIYQQTYLVKTFGGGEQ